MTDDGELKDYLGTRFKKNKNYGSITLTQPRTVKIILELVGPNYASKTVKIHDNPAFSNKLLNNEPYRKPRVQKWNYSNIVRCDHTFCGDRQYISLRNICH